MAEATVAGLAGMTQQRREPVQVACHVVSSWHGSKLPTLFGLVAVQHGYPRQNHLKSRLGSPTDRVEQLRGGYELIHDIIWVCRDT